MEKVHDSERGIQSESQDIGVGIGTRVKIAGVGSGVKCFGQLESEPESVGMESMPFVDRHLAWKTPGKPARESQSQK